MYNPKPGTFTAGEVECKSLVYFKGQICIAEKLQQCGVAWYHEYLAHHQKGIPCLSAHNFISPFGHNFLP